MSWFRRKKRSDTSSSPDRSARRADVTHLEEFHASRRGVEAFVEPKTTVTQTTVMLIAHDGEWTRRKVEDVEAAFRLGDRLGMPVYEVSKVGYPKRMREYNERQRLTKKRKTSPRVRE